MFVHKVVMLATSYSTFILLKNRVNNNRLLSLSDLQKVCSGVHIMIEREGTEHIVNRPLRGIKLAGKEEKKTNHTRQSVRNF